VADSNRFQRTAISNIITRPALCHLVAVARRVWAVRNCEFLLTSQAKLANHN